MSEQSPSTQSPRPGALSAIRAAEVADLQRATERTAGRVFLLAVVGIIILGWVLLEVTTPLVAMGATFLAIFPIKLAVRRFLALESKKERFLEISGEKAGDDL